MSRDPQNFFTDKDFWGWRLDPKVGEALRAFIVEANILIREEVGQRVYANKPGNISLWSNQQGPTKMDTHSAYLFCVREVGE